MTQLLDPMPARSRAEPSELDKTRPAKPLRLREGPLVPIADAELVKLTLKGDADAYGELVNRYQHAIRNLARAMVHDYQIAEDISQDAFIKAFNSLADLKEPEKYGGWVAAILRHGALDHLRSTKNSLSLETLQEEGFELEKPGESPWGAEAMEAREDEMRALEALANLREDYREIIILKHVEKVAYKEIAKRLNMSVSAVGEKLSRVRALLKRRLEKQQVKSSKRHAKPE